MDGYKDYVAKRALSCIYLLFLFLLDILLEPHVFSQPTIGIASDNDAMTLRNW